MTVQTITCAHCGAELEADVPAEVPADSRDVRVECHAPLLGAEGAPVTNAAGTPLQCERVTVVLTRPPSGADLTLSGNTFGGTTALSDSDSVGSIDVGG